MNSKFQPKFPQTVSGDNYRRPFSNAAVERVSKEMDRIYSEVDLYKDDRALLLDMYQKAAKAHYRLVSLEGAEGPIKGDGGAYLREVEGDLIAFCLRLDLDLNTKGWDDI